MQRTGTTFPVSAEATAMPRRLTDRQGDVLRLLCRGMTRKQAAAELGIAVGVVGIHVFGIRARLGPDPIAELCERCPDDLAAAEERTRRRAEVGGQNPGGGHA